MEYTSEAWSSSAPKHVLFVSGPCCTRVEKQAEALRLRGWRVDSLSMLPPKREQAFDIIVVAQQHRMADLIAESGASVIHVHNEPDVLMRYASDGARGRPLIYDCHDLEFYRLGRVSDDEMFAFQRADGIVHVSHEHGAIAWGLHRWGCPTAYVYSTPLRSRIPERHDPLGGVVYHGGACMPGTVDWRDLTIPCREFADAGIPFDLFTREGLPYPRNRGWREYDDLLAEVSRYTFGFIGSDPRSDKFDVAVPNKLWEYAACGVIPLIVNAPAAAKAFGSGIVATSTRDAIRQLRECDIESMRADVLAHARYMDDEIVAVESLYEEATCSLH